MEKKHSCVALFIVIFFSTTLWSMERLEQGPSYMRINLKKEGRTKYVVIVEQKTVSALDEDSCDTGDEDSCDSDDEIFYTSNDKNKSLFAKVSLYKIQQEGESEFVRDLALFKGPPNKPIDQQEKERYNFVVETISELNLIEKGLKK